MTDTRLVWSTGNPCPAIDLLMEKHNDDIDAVILDLSGGSCSRDGARQMADAFAPCLGITPADFMKRWRRVFPTKQ